MSALPALPPRQRPAFASVLLTVSELGPEPQSRRTLLGHSGLSWTSWRESVGRLLVAGFLRVEKGTRDGREASYSLTTEGRAAAQELAAHPGAWAPESRRPPAAHPAPRSPRARSSSSSSAFKATRNEKAAASSPPGARLADAHPDARRWTDAELDRIGRAAAREALRLLGPALVGVLHRDLNPHNATQGPPNRETARAETVQSPNATPAEAPEARTGPPDPEALALAINRPGHPDLEDVSAVLSLEARTEDDALAIGRHVLDRSPPARVPVALARSLARGETFLAEKDRRSALAAKEPPAKAPRELSTAERFRLESLETRIRQARLRGHQHTVDELEAERATLARSGAA